MKPLRAINFVRDFKVSIIYLLSNSSIIICTYCYRAHFSVRGYNHSKNVDDEELPEQLILDDQQNGLHNQQDEQDWRQDGDNPVRVPTGAIDIGEIQDIIS